MTTAYTNEEIKDLLEKARDAYYNTGSPIMSDAEYDTLLEKLGEENPIGAKPRKSTRFEVLKHEIPMSSLNKSRTSEEVESWAASIGVTDLKSEVVIQPKLDGLSLEVVYDVFGKIQIACLRGDGIEGENVIENAIKFLPETITTTGKRVVVRGEVVISQDNFDAINAGTYANRRNSVAGIIRRLDGKYCDKLTLVAYDIEFPGFAQLQTEELKLQVLNHLGFEVPFCYSYDRDLLEKLEPERNGKYLLDGLVLKLNDVDKMKTLGFGANRNPIGHLAYKFPCKDGETYVIDVSWEVGKTGKITPVALVEPTTIQGSTISRVTLASYRQFKEHGLCKNKKVLVKRVNDVIPILSKSAVLTQDRELVALPEPTNCPGCGAAISKRITKNEVTDIFCSNPECPAALAILISEKLKNTLKTKGFGLSLVKELIDSGKIQNCTDIYKLSCEDIEQGSKLSKERAIKFHEMLHENLKSLEDWKFLDLFGLDGVAEKSLKALTSKYTLEEILKLSLEECIENLKTAKGKSFYDSKDKLKSKILELKKLL